MTLTDVMVNLSIFIL